MINYIASESGPFSATREEVEKLSPPLPLRFTVKSEVIGYINDKWGSVNNPIEAFELRPLPAKLKKNNADSAKLLVMYRQSGEVKIKRHNNSQWLRLE